LTPKSLGLVSVLIHSGLGLVLVWDS